MRLAVLSGRRAEYCEALQLRPHFPALAQRLRERSRVDVFELAADRNAAREPRDAQIAIGQQLAEVVRGRLTLVGEVRREDHLAHDAVGCALQQPIETDLPGPDAVERRKAPHQYEIQARIRL